jgi:hypothetical protein
MGELFAARVRSSGTSLGFQLGGVLSGGLAPVLAAALVGATGNLLAVAGLMLALGVVSIASLKASPVVARRESSLEPGAEISTRPTSATSTMLAAGLDEAGFGDAL